MTPDRHHGEQDEEGTVYDNWPAGNDPPLAGGVRYVDGDFRLRDHLGVFNPRDGGTGFDVDTILVDDGNGNVLTDIGTKTVMVTP